MPIPTRVSLLVFLVVGFAISDCAETRADDGGEAQLLPRTKRVLTQEEQAALTPKQVLELLIKGNDRFVAGSLTKRNHSKQVRKAASGQFPKAVVLSCLDARIPVEDVFDCGIGDLFVARVAGNFANIDIVGSMEFACKVSGAHVALVLGHERCGAVLGAIDGVELGNITAMLANIQPAVAAVQDVTGERKSTNKEFVRQVTAANIRNTITYIREKSPILRGMEANGDIILVGGVYSIETGKVTLLD